MSLANRHPVPFGVQTLGTSCHGSLLIKAIPSSWHRKKESCCTALLSHHRYQRKEGQKQKQKTPLIDCDLRRRRMRKSEKEDGWAAFRNRREELVVQSWAIRWALGCVNSRPAAGGSQEAGFTQLRAHLIAQLCTIILSIRHLGSQANFVCQLN